ncbi:MAG: transposase [Sphingomonadales bacterium]|nr:transposase [Sphingomonadales bacterium]
MPRSARIVIPNVAHHVIQRGNRRQAIFHDDGDRAAYTSMLANALKVHQTKCLAWCLMDNHVHLILVPQHEDGLRAPLASVHTNYAQYFNRKLEACGHLFQGRFLSYPMDDAHLMVAARYIENNPVKADMVEHAGDWTWSSARAHLGLGSDSLTDAKVLGRHIANWDAMLTDGLEASDRIESALKSGRPLADPEWVSLQAKELGRSLTPPKRGRPKKNQK